MNIVSIVISLFALLFAITIHEASHAWAALKKGDPTASLMGRVSLNPLAHIDPIGTVLLPLLLVITGAPAFGWAKPVIVNSRNLGTPARTTSGSPSPGRPPTWPPRASRSSSSS
jgi:Zn-dependent protease